MPATSDEQRTLYCIALSIKRGDTPATYSEEVARMAQEMDEETLREFCDTWRRTKNTLLP